VSEEDQVEPEVAVNASDGRRTVSWAVQLSDGSVTCKHDFPDAVRHHYQPGVAEEDLWLYVGACSIDDDDDYVGDVRWRWGRVPRIEVRGSRPTRPSDFNNLSAALGRSSRWVAASELTVSLPDGVLPAQPAMAAIALAEPKSGAAVEPVRSRSSVTRPVQQELGTSVGLDRVTFLVPNGWDGHDASGVCSTEALTQIWHGRTDACGGDWQVIFDLVPGMDQEAWRELKDIGGHRFTHTGQLSRVNGETFNGQEAFDALDRVRLGLNLALGRRTTCALPVGWRQEAAVWCRWRSAPVDEYCSSSDWLDETIACQQVRDAVSLMLDFTADEANLAAVRPALAYYVAGNVDVDVELSVAVPLSALQLLAYYRFVEQRATYSQTKWKELTTEKQVRLLLDEIHVDLAIHPHFQHLVAVQSRLGTAATQPGRPAPQAPDGLGVVVRMRNVVMHPTKKKPNTFDVYEWAEAGMHVRYWLCLALLNSISYVGQVSAILDEKPPWTGQVRATPWAP